MFTITESPEQNRTTAAMFRRAVKIAGLDMPAFDPATIPAPAWTPATPQQISEAAFDVASKGADPSADKKVQALLMSKLLGDAIGGLHWRHELAVSKAELEHQKAHAPALLEQLATAFQDDVQAMADANEVIGHMDLADGLRRIGSLPSAQGTAVVTAHAANARTTSMIEALPVIAAAAGERLDPGSQWARLTWCKPRVHQFADHRLHGLNHQNPHGRAHNVWDAIGDGITVELATTAAELKARAARIEREEADSRIDHRAEDAASADAKAQAKALGLA